MVTWRTCWRSAVALVAAVTVVLLTSQPQDQHRRPLAQYAFHDLRERAHLLCHCLNASARRDRHGRDKDTLSHWSAASPFGAGIRATTGAFHIGSERVPRGCRSPQGESR